MAETVSMPKLGFDMAEGNLVRWLKKENDPVEKGQVLAEIETDKATVEVESPFSGIVLKLIVDEGTSVPVGSPIAIIGADGEAVDSMISTEPEKQGSIPEITQGNEKRPAEQSMTGVDILASPLAKRIAREKSIDLSKIVGSGPGGRIVRKDVESAMTQGNIIPQSVPGTARISSSLQLRSKEVPGDSRIPINKLRAAIGRRMTESKQSVPHFYVTNEINVERMLDLREQINSLLPEDEKLSINDFIIKAAAVSLRQLPSLNSAISGNEIIHYGHVNIGVAVSVEGGLLTIVVKDADIKDLRQISIEIREMAERVRSGKVKTEDIEGSTFSISNLGMYDVENFAAIINPPESAILAIASVQEKVVITHGEVTVGMRMKATLSADHRVTDGVEAAKFMQVFKQVVETPVQLLV